MNLSWSLSGDVVILELQGLWDARAVPIFQQTAADLWKGNAIFVAIDVADVTDMDSAVLAAIVTMFRSLQARGGNLALLNAKGKLLKTLQEARLDQVFLDSLP